MLKVLNYHNYIHIKLFEINKNAYLYPSQLMSQIVDNGKLDKISRKNLSTYHYIAGPVYRPNHWCLFIADCLKEEITYIDPLGTNKKNCEDVLDKWKL